MNGGVSQKASVGPGMMGARLLIKEVCQLRLNDKEKVAEFKGD